MTPAGSRRNPPELPHKPVVVALRALGLGDFLCAVPALRALRRAFPRHRRVLLAPGWLAPLVALAGTADATVDVDFRHAVPPDAVPPDVGRVDVAVNLHGAGPQSHRLLAALRPRRLLAYANAEAGADGPSWPAADHERDRWCRLLLEEGIPADPADLDLARPPAPFPLRGATIVHPGAASPARRWPARRWAELAAAEAADGRRVLVTGSAAEAGLAAGVAARAGLPREAVIAGRTSLLGLAGVVAAAGRVVCGDTGVAHLATALRTPSVILFGPVAPAQWGPPPERPWHRALWHGAAGDPHSARPDAGLLAITVAEVRAALADLPAAAARAPAA